MSKSLKYVKNFEFPADCGYTGSAGRTMVKGYARGGAKEMCEGGAYAKGGMPNVKNVMRNERKEMNRMKGAPSAPPGMLRNVGALGVLANKNPAETRMNTAPALPGQTMMKKGGSIKRK